MSEITEEQERVISHINRDNLPIAPCGESHHIVPVGSTLVKKEKIIRTLFSEKYGDYDLVKK